MLCSTWKSSCSDFHDESGNLNEAVSVSCLNCASGFYTSAKEKGCKVCEGGKYQELAAGVEYACKHCVAGKAFTGTYSTLCN